MWHSSTIIQILNNRMNQCFPKPEANALSPQRTIRIEATGSGGSQDWMMDATLGDSCIMLSRESLRKNTTMSGIDGKLGWFLMMFHSISRCHDRLGFYSECVIFMYTCTV